MSDKNNIIVKITPDDLKFVPSRQSSSAAGLDLVANLDNQSLTIKSRTIEAVDVGFSMALPEGWEAQIRSRSGLSSRGIIVANSPGTIDSDYRGRIKVLLANISETDFVVKHGDRIAQMVVKPTYDLSWQITNDLGTTFRGSEGFGSTGV